MGTKITIDLGPAIKKLMEFLIKDFKRAFEDHLKNLGKEGETIVRLDHEGIIVATIIRRALQNVGISFAEEEVNICSQPDPDQKYRCDNFVRKLNTDTCSCPSRTDKQDDPCSCQYIKPGGRIRPSIDPKEVEVIFEL